MAFIPASREQYKPEDDLKESGQFVAVCSDVMQGIDWPAYPKKSRIAIQFTVSDDRYPELKGKKTAIVCGESVYKPKSGGKPSHLYSYAVQMGVTKPETGFDPAVFLDKWFLITTELYEDKAFVRSAVPIPSQSKGGKDAAKTAASSAPVATPVGRTEDIPF